jgi:hypothetical protein
VPEARRFGLARVALSPERILQVAKDQRLHRRPDFGIAFDLNGPGGEKAGMPGKVTTFGGLLVVIHTEITENRFSGQIGGHHSRLTVLPPDEPWTELLGHFVETSPHCRPAPSALPEFRLAPVFETRLPRPKLPNWG